MGWIPKAFGIAAGVGHAWLYFSGGPLWAFSLDVAFWASCRVMRKVDRMYRAKVLKHSVSPEGQEVCTFQIELPRQVLAEVITHRKNSDSWGDSLCSRTTTPEVSKNSASSRAIPLSRMIEKVLTDPYVPERFGANQAGMQASAFLEGADHELAVRAWLLARDFAVVQAMAMLSWDDRKNLHDLHGTALKEVHRCMQMPIYADQPSVSVHKQDVNRLLEPWGWVLQVVTATDWDNFFALRCDEMAAPAFRKIARIMYVLKTRSSPEQLDYGEWHLPYVDAPVWSVRSGLSSWAELCDLSAARCAWTSYWPPEGGDADREKVARTLAKLAGVPLHASPYEHQATPMRTGEVSLEHLRSNLRGWVQLRKLIPGEFCKIYLPTMTTVASWGITEEELAAVQV